MKDSELEQIFLKSLMGYNRERKHNGRVRILTKHYGILIKSIAGFPFSEGEDKAREEAKNLSRFYIGMYPHGY